MRGMSLKLGINPATKANFAAARGVVGTFSATESESGIICKKELIKT